MPLIYDESMAAWDRVYMRSRMIRVGKFESVELWCEKCGCRYACVNILADIVDSVRSHFEASPDCQTVP